jgi:transposase
MRYYIGLDVSNKETNLCVVDETGQVLKYLKTKTEPHYLAKAITKLNLEDYTIGLESGNLSSWLIQELDKFGIKVICLDAKRMHAIIETNINKTDRNDAREIALALKNNNYRKVHQKSQKSVELNVIMRLRENLVKEQTNLKNTIRGCLKAYGIRVREHLKSARFIEEVRGQLAFDKFSVEKRSTYGYEAIEQVLSCIERQSKEVDQLDKQIEELCQDNEIIQRWMAIPGVGYITAVTFMATIDDPSRFKNARSIGAFLGLTPKQYSSGETVHQGKVSKCGPSYLRSLLIQAGIRILTVCQKWSKLKAFGKKIMRKRGLQKAAVAVARKLSIIMLKMWQNGTEFEFGEVKNKSEMEKLEELIKKSAILNKEESKEKEEARKPRRKTDKREEGLKIKLKREKRRAVLLR